MQKISWLLEMTKHYVFLNSIFLINVDTYCFIVYCPLLCVFFCVENCMFNEIIARCCTHWSRRSLGSQQLIAADPSITWIKRIADFDSGRGKKISGRFPGRVMFQEGLDNKSDPEM